MVRISESEKHNLPDHNEISKIKDEEFRINKVNKSQQIVWITTDNGMHISILLNHINPESEVGNLVKKFEENKFVQLSAVRLQKSEDHMPRWYLTGVSKVREPQGSEKNVFKE